MAKAIHQVRVLVACPLCGLRQRVDHLTGLHFGPPDPGGALELRAGVVYTEKGTKGLQWEWRPVRLTDAQRLEYLRALAAKVMPLVDYLRALVPEFAEAVTERVIYQVEVGAAVRVEYPAERRVTRERPVLRERSVFAASDLEMEVERWSKVEVQLPRERPVTVISPERPVAVISPMDGT